MTPPDTDQAHHTQPDQSNKHRTAAIQKSIETGDRGPLAHFDTRHYRQHNLMLGDGFAALLAFLDSLPPGSSRVTPLRLFEDGDISFAHLEYYLEPMGHVVGFEVHRWEDGRIVEHWDNLQTIPDTPNAAGLTMLDGTAETEARSPELTIRNKEFVRRFLDDVVIGGRTDGEDDEDGPADVAEFLDPGGVVDHSPHEAGGLGGLLSGSGADGSATYETLHHLFGDGDFCLAICEGTLDQAPAAFYDLVRLDAGRIVEHWDVVETIPPRDQWRNDNGKF